MDQKQHPIFEANCLLSIPDKDTADNMLKQSREHVAKLSEAAVRETLAKAVVMLYDRNVTILALAEEADMEFSDKPAPDAH
jgi:hypothetical protein